MIVSYHTTDLNSNFQKNCIIFSVRYDELWRKLKNCTIQSYTLLFCCLSLCANSIHCLLSCLCCHWAWFSVYGQSWWRISSQALVLGDWNHIVSYHGTLLHPHSCLLLWLRQRLLGLYGLSLVVNFRGCNHQDLHLGDSGDRDVRQDNKTWLHRKNLRIRLGFVDSARFVLVIGNMQVSLWSERWEMKWWE